MKRIVLAVLVLFAVLVQGGCGDSGTVVSNTFVAQMISNPGVDGDIAQTSPGVFVVTEGMTLTPPVVQSVFAGIDPISLVESRAFLDFTLSGVPTNAVIVSATLDVVIDSLQPTTGSVPLRIDLVSFPPPLIGTDFDRTILLPLASIAVPTPITAINVDPTGLKHVFIDVTPLMATAQLQALPLTNFQIRIFEDMGVVPLPAPGRVEIDDTTLTVADRNAFAPLLEVVYF